MDERQHQDFSALTGQIRHTSTEAQTTEAAKFFADAQQVEEVSYPDKNMGQGKSRGLALIVSMESGRRGADVDRGKLAKLFLTCGFKDVQQHVDLKASELIKMIKSVAESGRFEEDEAFICSINGHGGTHDDGQLYIMDEEKVKVMLMREIIEPLRRSKHLFNKPKVFFVNCCRGTKLYDVNWVVDEADQVSHDDHDAAQDAHDDQQGTRSLRPHLGELSDCLLVFSTSEGGPSCRNPEKGTIFVQKLVETVTKERQTTDVLSMMTNVNFKVNRVQNFAMVDGTKVEVGQCCEVRTFLLKKLYWKCTGIVPNSESVAMADSGAPRPTHDADGAPPSYIVLHPHAVPSAVVSITSELIGLLGKVKQLHDERADNNDVMQEIKLFITQLERDLNVLKGLTPLNNSSTSAAESLLLYLRKAADYVDYFKSMWNVHTVGMKLARIRENVLTQFPVTLQYIQIDEVCK